MEPAPGTSVADQSLSDYKVKLSAEPPVCTERGCSNPPSDDSSLCKRHHDSAKRRARESMQRSRDARRGAKLCIWCPASKPAKATDGSTSCFPCRIKRNRMRSSDGGVNGDVNDGRFSKLASATRTHSDGRTRYHGQQKRGQQPKWQLNLQDLRHVKEDFETFEAGIQMLGTPDAQAMHRSDRAAAELAVAHVGERMGRRVDDILERLGHFKQRHGKRDGE